MFFYLSAGISEKPTRQPTKWMGSEKIFSRMEKKAMESRPGSFRDWIDH